jgi:N-acetylmuramoyl-L-alanine amidase
MRIGAAIVSRRQSVKESGGKGMHVWNIDRLKINVIGWSFLGLVFALGLYLRWPPAQEVIANVIASRVIVLDPGHGGIDPGAVSATGLKEKDIALQIAQKVEKMLISYGAVVVNLRHEDADLAGEDFSGSVVERKRYDLQARVDIANDCQADFFVSIHLNADPSPRWFGAQTFYRQGSPAGQGLAESIQGELKQVLGNTKRQAKAAGEYYVLEKTDMPAVIVEAGFISNPEEAAKMADEAYQMKIAQGICQGIVKYLALPPEN